MDLLSLLKLIIFKIILIIFVIISLPFFLLIFIFVLPLLLLWRQLVQLGAKICHPTWHLMSARNSIAATDDLYHHPEQSIVVVGTLSGPLDPSVYLGAVEEWLKKNGEVYSELKKFYTSWGGFLFWQNEEKFDLRNHFRVYQGKGEGGDGTEVTFDEVKEFCLELLTKPFVKERSPWELIQVQNVKDKEANSNGAEGVTVLIFHGHHGLGDGLSWLECFAGIVDQWDGTRKKMPLPVWSKGAQSGNRFGFIEKVLNYTLMILMTPYHVIKESIQGHDSNFFRLDEKKLTKKYFLSQVQIPIKFVKECRQLWGVTFSTILYAAITGGFRSFMTGESIKVPDYFNMFAVFPWPQRKSQGLQNHMCSYILKLPVGTGSMKWRVHQCESLWNQMKGSTVPLMNWTLAPIFGLFPTFMTKLFIRNDLTTMVFSNFPGPPEKIDVLGQTTENVEFVPGLWRGNCGIGISVISCNDLLTINLQIDQAILSSLKVEKLSKLIHQEFQMLAQESISTV